MESSTEPAKWLYECEDLQTETVKKQGTCRKCPHKSPRVCYGDLSTDSEQIQSQEKLSGESEEKLIETVNFESEESEPAIEKCLKFWKSILDANLKPTKFHLKEEKTVEKLPKTVSKKAQEDQPFRWRDLFEQIKRFNLDKVKLFRKVECKSINPDDLDCGLKSIKSRRLYPKYKPRSKKTVPDRKKHRSKEKPTRRRRKLQFAEPSSSKPKGKQYLTFEEEKLERERREREKLLRHLAKRQSCSASSKSTEEHEEADYQEPICCICGCGTDYCICEECHELTPELLEEIKNQSLQLAKEISIGQPLLCPCGCLMQCECDQLTKLDKFDCPCGCRVNDCICKLYPEDEEKSGFHEEFVVEDPWQLHKITANSYCIICGGYCSCGTT